MDSRKIFFEKIYKYYQDASMDKIDANYLIELSKRISDYYYEQYSRFRKQYPKSSKRYSEFKFEDLNHPETVELIINFFKEKLGDKYFAFSKVFLNMTDSQLKSFEINRELYHNK